MGLNPVAVTYTSDIAPVSRKEFFDIQSTIEYSFILKCESDMIITYSLITPCSKFIDALYYKHNIMLYLKVHSFVHESINFL